MCSDQIKLLRNECKNLKTVDIDNVIKEWKMIDNMPFRTEPDDEGRRKLFELANRKGKIKDENDDKNKDETKRNEDHLCMAIFNRYRYNPEKKEKLIVAGYSQYIVDYQTPIKKKETDSGWGKIDLVGLVKRSSRKQLVFWEMKWPGGDDPLYASIELLIYAKPFDKYKDKSEDNLKSLLFEIFSARGFKEAEELKAQPLLFVAAPHDYWSKCEEKYVGFLDKIKCFKNKIEKIKFEIEYWDLGNIKERHIIIEKNMPKFVDGTPVEFCKVI